MLRYDGREPVLQFFKTSLQQVIDPDFKPKHSIICQGMDKSEELSTGLDAKIYFDILSYETTQDGIYIIDQPEDNVQLLFTQSNPANDASVGLCEVTYFFSNDADMHSIQNQISRMYGEG